MSKLPLTAAAGGGLLALGASDDADALIIHPGLKGATKFAGHRAGDRKAPRIGIDPRGNAIPEQVMAREIDQLKKNMRMLKGRPDRQSKLVMEFIHKNTDYGKSNARGSWLNTAKNIDGGVNGPLYLTGVDILAEDLITTLGKEFQPAIEHYARRRIGDGGRSAEYGGQAGEFIAGQRNLKGTFDPKDGALYQQKAERLPREDFVDPNTGRKKAGRASLSVGAPSLGQDHLQATMHNREQKLNEHMDNLGLTKDPMYEYGSLLPVKSNIVTGERSLAAPDMLRDVMRGILGLGMTSETGVYDPQNLLDTVL